MKVHDEIAMSTSLQLAAALSFGAALCNPVAPRLPSGTYLSEDGAELLIVQSAEDRPYVSLERPLLCTAGSWCSTVLHASGANTYSSTDGETGRPTADAVLDVSAGARNPVLATWDVRPVHIPFRYLSSPHEARRARDDFHERNWFKGRWLCSSEGLGCATSLELGVRSAEIHWSTTCTSPGDGAATILSARSGGAGAAAPGRGPDARTVSIETDARQRFLQRFAFTTTSHVAEGDASVELWLGDAGSGTAFARCGRR